MRMFIVTVLDKSNLKLTKIPIYHENKATVANYVKKYWLDNCSYDYKIVDIEETVDEELWNSLFILQ